MNNDLGKYMFQHFENAYNIGWNANQYSDVNKNDKFTDMKFLECLSEFCKYPLNKNFDGKHRKVEIDGKKYVKGFGEIRVLDIKNNIRYAAPDIIIDDIIEGVYIPPKEFIKAVKNGPKPIDAEYSKFLLKYTAENYWGEDENNVKKIKIAQTSIEKGIKELKKVIDSEDVINCVTSKGSLLNYSIVKGKTEEALYLIEKGIDINAFEGIELLNAIERNMTEVVNILIEKKIYMETNEISRNPLISAIRYNNKELVLKLLNYNKQLIKTYSNEYVRNCTILDVAKRCQNQEIISIIKEYYL